MKLYSYLYYKIYCGLRNLGNWDLPFKSMCALSTLEIINVTELFFSNGIFPFETHISYDYKIVLGVIYLLIVVINSYLFLHKKKYLEIEKRFKGESKTQKIIGDVVVAIYVLFTLGFVFYLPRFV